MTEIQIIFSGLTAVATLTAMIKGIYKDIKDKKNENDNIKSEIHDIKRFNKIEEVINKLYDNVKSKVEKQNEKNIANNVACGTIDELLDINKHNEICKELKMDEIIELSLLKVLMITKNKIITPKDVIDLQKKYSNVNQFTGDLREKYNANNSDKNKIENSNLKKESEDFINEIFQIFYGIEFEYKFLEEKFNNIFYFQREMQNKYYKISLKKYLKDLESKKENFENSYMYKICKKFEIYQGE